MNEQIVIPLLLRSFGRSGTTMMMELLGTNNNILFERTYPFENRYLTYICRLGQLPSLDPEKINSDWNQDSLMIQNTKILGPLPYRNIKLFNKQEFSKKIIGPLWRTISKEMLSSAALNIKEPVYYAEKIPHDIPQIINSAVYTKSIFLFRDPRDEFLSIKSFNTKRGFHAFGWLESDDDYSFAKKLCNSRKNFMKTIFEIPDNDSRRHVVFYENIVQDPNKETSKLSDWLGLPLSWKRVVDEHSQYAHHMTSSDISSSAGRWKNEMDKSLQSVFSELIGPELTNLGYEV